MKKNETIINKYKDLVEIDGVAFDLESYQRHCANTGTNIHTKSNIHKSSQPETHNRNDNNHNISNSDNNNSNCNHIDADSDNLSSISSAINTVHNSNSPQFLPNEKTLELIKEVKPSFTNYGNSSYFSSSSYFVTTSYINTSYPYRSSNNNNNSSASTSSSGKYGYGLNLI